MYEKDCVGFGCVPVVGLVMVEGVIGLVVGPMAGALVSAAGVVAFLVVSGVVRGKNLGAEGTNFGFFRYFLFFRGLLSGVS
jgi:hypothetical protein